MRRVARCASAEGVASSTSLTFSSAISLADLLGPQHLDAMHQLAGERGIGVDEGDHLVAAGLVQRAQQLDADGAGAVDDHRLALVEAQPACAAARPEQQRPGPLPAQANEAGGDQAVDHHHRTRMVLDAAHQHDAAPTAAPR